MLPIFSSSAIVTLIAFVFALAAYLRLISANCEEKIEKIRNDENNLVWPAGAEHTNLKLSLLRRTRTVIESFTPFIFAMACACAVRLIVFSMSFLWSNEDCLNVFLSWVDIILSALVFVGISGMWIAHSVMKADERKIRILMDHYIARKAADRPRKGM